MLFKTTAEDGHRGVAVTCYGRLFQTTLTFVYAKTPTLQLIRSEAFSQWSRRSSGL